MPFRGKNGGVPLQTPYPQELARNYITARRIYHHLKDIRGL